MDPNTTSQIVSGLGGIVVLVAVVLAIEWVFLPFAIFGIKSKLDAIREGISKTNHLLEEIAKKSDKANGNE